MNKADLIARLDAGELVTTGDWDDDANATVEYQPCGLVLREDLPFDEWLSIGETLKRMEKSVQWWIGDWLRFGERKYGEMYTQALETTGYDYGTLRNFKYVADKVELSLRNDNVPFSYHALIASLPPTIQAQVLDKVESERLTWREVREEVREIKQDIEVYPNGFDNTKAETRPVSYHVADDSYDWYTPAEYIEAARAVLGSIDLDPASSDEAQEVVQASTYFTKEIDGLTQVWFGNVWMNPPYNMPLIEQFVDKVLAEYEAGNVNAAIVLTNNATDTRWFHALLEHPLCLTKGRIRFWAGNGSLATRQGQAFFYLGDKPDLFAAVFSEFGQVMRRYAEPS